MKERLLHRLGWHTKDCKIPTRYTVGTETLGLCNVTHRPRKSLIYRLTLLAKHLINMKEVFK